MKSNRVVFFFTLILTSLVITSAHATFPADQQAELKRISASISIFEKGNFNDIYAVANSMGLSPEGQVVKLRSWLVNDLKSVRLAIVLKRVDDMNANISSIETSKMMAEYDLVVAKAMTASIFKTGRMQTRESSAEPFTPSRYYQLLDDDLGESLMIERSGLAQTAEPLKELIELRKFVQNLQSLGTYDAGGIQNVYSAVAWISALKAEVPITPALRETMNEMSSAAQVKFFNEMLKQKYSLTEARLEKILTIAKTDENPALMLAMLGDADVAIEKESDYEDLFKLTDDSQIEYANFLIMDGGGLFALHEAAKGINCKFGLNTRNPWL